MSFLVPIVVEIPVLAILALAVQVHLPTSMEVIEVSGYLRALTSGTCQVDVSDSRGTVFGSLVWMAAGTQIVELDRVPFSAGGRLVYDVISIGVGAAGCYVSIWGTTA